MSSGEKRKYRRVKAKNVSGHVSVNDDVVALGLPIDNISIGGLFVRCGEPLPVGTRVAIELPRPAPESALRVTGTTVVAIDAMQGLASGAVPGMGIRFDTLAPQTLTRLTQLLRELVGAGAVAAPNPAQLDDAARESRRAFDFSFVSHEHHPEAPPAAFSIPSAAPADHPATKDALRGADTLMHPPSGVRARGEGAKERAGAADRSTRQPAAVPAREEGSSRQVRTANPSRPPPPEIRTPEPAATTSTRASSAAETRPSDPVAPIHLNETARLHVQVRGLLQDLGDRESELARRDREIESLRSELERARRELVRKDARISELELRLARAR